MTAPVYGREALRRLREQEAQAAQEPERQLSLFDQVPPDAPMDDATLTVWNGERFVAYDKWLATAPLVVEEQPQERGARITNGERTHETTDSTTQDSPVQKGLWESDADVDPDAS